MIDRPNPPRVRPERQRLVCQFDLDDPRPILGDLLRERRAGRLRSYIGQEIGISGNVVRDVESLFGCKQEEISLILKWLGVRAGEVQLPTPIQARPYGKPRRGESGDGPVANAILEHLRQGLPLTRFESRKHSISPRQAQRLVARWLHNDLDFRAKYEQARALGAHFLADQAVDIADDPTIDPKQAKNQIQARQWLAGQLNQRQFGRNAMPDVNVNIGFGEALEALERRREKKELPPPKDLTVIDITPTTVSDKVKR